NTPLFQPCGVCPACSAIVPTFSFTSVNMFVRFPSITPINKSLIQFVIASKMKSIGRYLRGLSKETGKQRNQRHANEGNPATGDKLFHALRFCLCVIKKQ